jgi:hypothetical protein
MNTSPRPGRRVALLFLSLVAVLTVLTSAGSARAIDPGPGGWYFTGSGTRVKKIAFVGVKVYTIRHDMKALPPAKSKQAVLEMDTDKRFTLQMQRDVDAEKIRNAFNEAYDKNAGQYPASAGDRATFLNVLNTELKEGQIITFQYSADKKATTLTAPGGASATVNGIGFMKATWSIWFGNAEQPDLGDAMISKL